MPSPNPSVLDPAPPAMRWQGGEAHPPLRASVAALGNFDGVHRGHKALVAEARRLAEARGVAASVLTFEPHPMRLFRPDAPHFRLSSPDIRAALLAREGARAVAEIPFDASLAALSPEAFVREVLIGRFDLAGVVTGEDFAFGKGRAGRAPDLKRLMAEAGRIAATVAPVRDAQGGVISSSRVRDLLAQGSIVEANALLGHRWLLEGEVVHGDKRGRLLGFPTANMILDPDCGLRNGVYAVRARVGGAWIGGAASFGRRPTFDDGAPRLETYLFDWSGDLYGQRIAVEFVAWIRGEEKFDSIDALIVQMREDCRRARQTL